MDGGVLGKQHTAEDAIAAGGSVGDAQDYATWSFSEGDTDKVRQVVTAKQWAKTPDSAKMVFARGEANFRYLQFNEWLIVLATEGRHLGSGSKIATGSATCETSRSASRGTRSAPPVE
jgi:hypothetical protein